MFRHFEGPVAEHLATATWHRSQQGRRGTTVNSHIGGSKSALSAGGTLVFPCPFPLRVGMASGRLLEVYLDLLSQPCRAIYLLLHACNIPHTVRTVALRKGKLLTNAKGSELS